MIWYDPPYDPTDSIMTTGIQDDNESNGIDIGTDSSSEDSEIEINEERVGSSGGASGGSQRRQSSSSYRGK